MRKILLAVSLAAMVAAPTASPANHAACVLTPAAPSCTFDAPGASAVVNGYVSSSCSAGMRIWVLDDEGNQVTKFHRASEALPGTGSLINQAIASGLDTGSDGKVRAEILPGGNLIAVGACALPNNRVGVVQIGAVAHG